MKIKKDIKNTNLEVELSDLLNSLMLFITFLSIAGFISINQHNLSSKSYWGGSLYNRISNPIVTPYESTHPGGGGGVCVNYANHGMQYNYSYGTTTWPFGYIDGGNGWFKIDGYFGYNEYNNKYYFVFDPHNSTFNVCTEAYTLNTNMKSLTGGTWNYTGSQNGLVLIPNSLYHINPNIAYENISFNGVTVESQSTAVTLTFTSADGVFTHQSQVEIYMQSLANGQVFGKMWHNSKVVINWALVKQLIKYFSSD